ncbi:MAG: TIGR04076 family protein [Tidjanibacter sp.]|nr:TIGR04076 family protein [Tidjanibacter sp.]
MKQCRITVMRKAFYGDLAERYENPIEHSCDLCVGQTFVSNEGEQPEGLCDSAWGSMSTFVKELSAGGGNFFDGWMKNPHSAIIACNDGFRPVSFLIEVTDE